MIAVVTSPTGSSVERWILLWGRAGAANHFPYFALVGRDFNRVTPDKKHPIIAKIEVETKALTRLKDVLNLGFFDAEVIRRSVSEICEEGVTNLAFVNIFYVVTKLERMVKAKAQGSDEEAGEIIERSRAGKGHDSGKISRRS